MNIQQTAKSALPHLLGIAVLLAIVMAYFNPLLDGRVLQQSDVSQWKGMSKEVMDYREKTGKEALWTNSMFGGMPAYQISMWTMDNLTNRIRGAMQKLLPEPANLMLFAMISFYLLLSVLGVSTWLAVAGALAFGLSTYNVLIAEAGHITKFSAMAYMPAVLAGVIMLYRGRYLAGAAVAGLAMAFNIGSNHYQITYYLLLLIALYVVSEAIAAVRNKTLPQFAKATAIMAAVFALAVASDATRMWTTYEYSKETMRGGSALTEGSDGLDKDYALAWSYGKMETMTLLVPRFYGGASGQKISKDSETGQLFRQNDIGTDEAPMYWGAQPFTGGPTYFGAVVCFLFLLGCLIVRGAMRWWLIAATVFSIALSWGKNFTPLTDLFFHFFPMYNKFRVVSMILVVAQLTMPMLGLMALQQVWSGSINQKQLMRALKISVGVLGGLLLFFILFAGGLFDFTGPSDDRYPEALQTALQTDRLAMLRADCIRSLILILVAAGAVWAFASKKLPQLALAGIMGVLILGDLWTIDQNYLSADDYVRKRNADDIFTPTAADKMILSDKDPDFRVLNLTRNPFSDAITSYHHKSLGGYHGAKLSRYQDLIDNQISKNNRAVLNMLNTRYIINEDANKQPVAQLNPEALGNAWLVSEVKPVQGAKAEMDALTNFDPKNTAVVDEKAFPDYLKGITVGRDSTDKITLAEYQPNYLKYNSTTTADNAMAVFSEIYYNDHKGWKAYIDGNETPHIRVNYVLRGLKIPKGTHTIEFKFEPRSYYTGNKISLAASSLLLLLAVAAMAMPFIAGKKEQQPV